MLSKLPMLCWMQVYYGAFKLLSLRDERPWMQTQVRRDSLYSGDHLQLTFGELGAVLSLFLLMIDLIAAYHKRDRALGQHLASFILFAACLVQFFTVRGYGHASFLIYLLSVLCELVAGMLIMLASRRELYPPCRGD